MNSALYYSNYCENCKKLLQILSKNTVSNINYICIDNRIIENNNGNQVTYIILENGNKTLLPHIVTKVPSLIPPDNKFILHGKQIFNYIQSSNNKTSTANQNEIIDPEPCSMNLDILGQYGVMSDNFSFLNQTSDELLAKGNGGEKQLYNYETINHSSHIIAPIEDFKPDKVGEVNINKLEEERNNDILQYKPELDLNKI